MSRDNELRGETVLIERENALRLGRPSYQLRPSLSLDGNRWCALYGDDLQTGVAGFGASPEEAFADFDTAWFRRVPK